MGQLGEHAAMKSNLLRHSLKFKSTTNFKGFEALHNIVLNINDRLICSDVQTGTKWMYDELR
jgi:hypothetical protein